MCGLEWREVDEGATLQMGYKLNYSIYKKKWKLQGEK